MIRSYVSPRWSLTAAFGRLLRGVALAGLALAPLACGGDDSDGLPTTPEGLCRKAATTICSLAVNHCQVCNDRGICGGGIRHNSSGRIASDPQTLCGIQGFRSSCGETTEDADSWRACLTAVEADEARWHPAREGVLAACVVPLTQRNQPVSCSGPSDCPGGTFCGEGQCLVTGSYPVPAACAALP